MRSLDISVDERAPRTAAEWLWPLLPIGVSVFCLSALVYYHLKHGLVEVRSALQVLIAGIYQTIGLAPSVMFFLLALTWSSIWFVTGRLDRPVLRLGRLLAMAVMLGVFLNVGDGGVAAAAHKGALGAWLAGCLVGAFGYFPSLVLVWAVTFASLLLATDFFFSDSFERLRQRPAGDAGVEVAVTDHLRGLAAVTPSAPAPAPTTETASPSPLADFGTATAVLDAPEAVASDVPPPVRSRRRSYYDRRRDEFATEVPAESVEAGVVEADDELDVAAVAEWGPVPPATEPMPRADAVAEVVAEVGRGESSAVAEAAPAADELPEPEFLILPAAGDGAASVVTPVGAGEPEPGFVAPAIPPAAIETPAEPDDETMAAAAAEAELAEPEPAEPEPAEPESAEAEPAEAEPAEPDPAAAELAADAAEALVPIPRPDPAARERAEDARRAAARRDEPEVRQQQLFGAEIDADLLAEAMELVHGQRRVTAALLQRRLRIDYDLAVELLAQLGARGVVELEGDATQGRVIV